MTCPAAGWPSAARTRASVVLPAPLRPTRPILSPGATWKDALSSNKRAPARSSISRAEITGNSLHNRTWIGRQADLSPHAGTRRQVRSGCMARILPEGWPIQRTGFRPGGAALGRPDPDGAEQPRRVLQDREPRVGHREEPVDGNVEVRPQPSVLAQRGHRPLVAAEYHGVELAAEAAEDPGGVVGGGLERLARLFLAAAREPVLRGAAGRTATVHQPTADLRRHQPRRGAGEHAGGVPAKPHEQHADRSVSAGVKGQVRATTGR